MSFLLGRIESWAGQKRNMSMWVRTAAHRQESGLNLCGGEGHQGLLTRVKVGIESHTRMYSKRLEL